jgi:hypothetical protein
LAVEYSNQKLNEILGCDLTKNVQAGKKKFEDSIFDPNCHIAQSEQKNLRMKSFYEIIEEI